MHADIDRPGEKCPRCGSAYVQRWPIPGMQVNRWCGSCECVFWLDEDPCHLPPCSGQKGE